MGLASLLRGLRVHRSVLPALADLVLGAVSVAAAVWAAERTGSVFIATWSLLLVQAAHIILVRRPQTAQQGLWPWIEEASKRLHRNTLVIALANKLARIAWAVLARGTDYRSKGFGYTN